MQTLTFCVPRFPPPLWRLRHSIKPPQEYSELENNLHAIKLNTGDQASLIMNAINVMHDKGAPSFLMIPVLLSSQHLFQ